MAHWTEKYIDIPFKSQGRSWEGLDCWGLIKLVYQEELGISLPSYLEYNEVRDHDRIKEIYDGALTNNRDGWYQIDRESQQVFDVLLLPMKGLHVHVGIIVDPKEQAMMHVTEGINVTIEKYTSLIWKSRYNRGYVYRYYG